MQDKQILYPLVLQEAKNLKRKAIKKEKENLNFSKLKPNNWKFCVYGQMTGDCFNKRAKELIDSCAKRVYIPNCATRKEIRNAIVNGKPNPEKSRMHYFSPIEVFIQQLGNKKNGNNEALIDYLKGKTEELVLN